MARKQREIEVRVNYPETDKGIQEFKESQATGVLITLRNILTPSQLETLMQSLEKEKLS